MTDAKSFEKLTHTNALGHLKKETNDTKRRVNIHINDLYVFTHDISCPVYMTKVNTFCRHNIPDTHVMFKYGLSLAYIGCLLSGLLCRTLVIAQASLHPHGVMPRSQIERVIINIWDLIKGV